MAAVLFTVFTAMEIGKAVLNCTKFRSALQSARNEAICSAIEFAVILIVALATGGFSWMLCSAILGMKLVFAMFGLLVNFVKNKGFGAEDKLTSKAWTIVGCAAEIILIFCFVFPNVVFPGYKEFEEKNSGKSIMEILLDESNKDSDDLSAQINTELFDFIINA